jgi:hypothetical protein
VAIRHYTREEIDQHSIWWVLAHLLWAEMSKPVIFLEKWFWYAIVWLRFGPDRVRETRAHAKLLREFARKNPSAAAAEVQRLKEELK